MKWIIFGAVFAICLFSYLANSSENRVRHVEVVGDQIVTVHTAIGIATILQVPQRPNSVIVGDQEGFRVEYLDRAITIKPLRAGARSNLYIYTDWKRFNAQLATGSEALADYVVYLEMPKTEASRGDGVHWRRYRKEMATKQGLRFRTKRLGKTSSGVVLIEFEVFSARESRFDPAWVWITQAGAPRPIQGLFLATTTLHPKEPVNGVIQLFKSDLRGPENFSVELRSEKAVSLNLPGVDTWK